MDLPLILYPPSTPSSSSSLSRNLLLSQFTSNPLRTKNSRKLLLTRNRRSKALVRSSASDPAELESPNSVNSSIFGGKKKLSGPPALVDGLSPPVRLATSAVIVAGALAAGYGLGLRIGGSRITGLGGAAALGAVGGAAVYALNSSVPEAAAASLHNFALGCDDPGAMKREDIEGIAKRLGLSFHLEAAAMMVFFFFFFSSY